MPFASFTCLASMGAAEWREIHGFQRSSLLSRHCFGAIEVGLGVHVEEAQTVRIVLGDFDL